MTKVMTESEFHEGEALVYIAPDKQKNRRFKKASGIANVVYQPAHKNDAAKVGQQGNGELLGKWLYNEQPDKQEKLLKSSIELFMDSRLAPNASVGLHPHTDTEEIYYLLEGKLEIELIGKDGTVIKQTITQGDTHLIQPGESHFIQAGNTGARFIVVAAKVDL
jgi:mannose-6-phosphate isomerase-like protein (cupin superfamily)